MQYVELPSLGDEWREADSPPAIRVASQRIYCLRIRSTCHRLMLKSHGLPSSTSLPEKFCGSCLDPPEDSKAAAQGSRMHMRMMHEMDNAGLDFKGL